MFDLSFSELMMIGIVALIVIGPERLPKVARTIGHLVGRAQRYVSTVKTDIQREMDLSEINNLKGQMQDAAHSMRASIQEASDTVRKPLEEARDTLGTAAGSVESLIDSARTELGSAAPPPPDLLTHPEAAARAAQNPEPTGTMPSTASPPVNGSAPAPASSPQASDTRPGSTAQ